jgi:hypothetical protein
MRIIKCGSHKCHAALHAAQTGPLLPRTRRHLCLQHPPIRSSADSPSPSPASPPPPPRRRQPALRDSSPDDFDRRMPGALLVAFAIHISTDRCIERQMLLQRHRWRPRRVILPKFSAESCSLLQVHRFRIHRLSSRTPHLRANSSLTSPHSPYR